MKTIDKWVDEDGEEKLYTTEHVVAIEFVQMRYRKLLEDRKNKSEVLEETHEVPHKSGQEDARTLNGSNLILTQQILSPTPPERESKV